jgi:hypothetical protein
MSGERFTLDSNLLALRRRRKLNPTLSALDRNIHFD